MGRRGRWLTYLIALAASFPALGPAAGPGVGSADTTSVLVSVGVSRDGANLQSVDVMNGSGQATNDIPKYSAHLAEVVLALARAEGEVQIDSAPFDVSARAEGPGTSSEGDTDLAVSLDFGETLTGDVAVASVQAGVDASSASASLSQVDAGARILNGLVSLEGVTIVGLTAESSQEAAAADQTIHVDSAYIFNMNELLGQFGRYFDDLSAGDLAALAERLIGPDAGDALEAAVADLGIILGHAEDLDAAVSVLEDGFCDPPDLSCVEAFGTIYDLATEYGVVPQFCPVPPDLLDPCDMVDKALETAGLVNIAIVQAQTLAEDAVDEAVVDLRGDLGALPLLTLNDVEVSVSAHAEDGNSAADAVISWGSAEVAGQPVPFADLQEAAVVIGAALTEALNDLGDAFGITFGLELSFPSPSDSTGSNGDYQTAEAAATAFSMAVSSTSASGVETEVALSLLSMTASADHKPSADDGGGDNGSDGGGDNGSTDGDNGSDGGGDNGSDGGDGGSGGGDENSGVLGENQEAAGSSGSGQPSPTNNSQTNQGTPSSSAGGPGGPGSSPTLPRTGVEAGRLMLLACQLILLGWALEWRQRLIEKTSPSSAA